MTGAVLCMAFYNVWSRPFIQRSSALGFLAVGMGAGAAGAGDGRPADRPAGGAARLRRGAVDRRRLSRHRRRRARVHPLGDGAAARIADAGRQHHDGQSDRGGAARRRNWSASRSRSTWCWVSSRCFAGIWIATTEPRRQPADDRRSIMTDLRGQVAVVTGGGRGLGRAFAQALAATGCAVAVTRGRRRTCRDGRIDRESGGRRARSSRRDRCAGRHRGIRGDRAIVRPGRSAGRQRRRDWPARPVRTSSVDDWWRAIDVDLRGQVLCAHRVLPA